MDDNEMLKEFDRGFDAGIDMLVETLNQDRHEIVKADNYEDFDRQMEFIEEWLLDKATQVKSRVN